MVTDARPDTLVLSVEVAVTVTPGGVGTLAGAVYKPLEVIVPQLVPEQPAPLTDQVTFWFADHITVALK